MVPFVPHRHEDGYDLQPETVRRAAAEGVRVILTADCGIVAFEAARAARELGVDLVVTDHHEPDPGGRLPEALAVVNPMRPDSRYPFPTLCGTAVVYKLCTALVRHLGMPEARFRGVYLDLVALATCADCMPLRDENRIFVKHGLDTLRETRKAGLRALMRVANVAPATVTGYTLGFVLAPRINAIGRMDAAAHALDLLLCSDEREADTLAGKLDQANKERQLEQERVLSEALRQAERFNDDPLLVLASAKWHPGVIGIVASKIAESLCRPTVMVALDEAAGTGRGSCRSIEGFHVFEALNACRHLLLRCGGHQAAAGFSIEPAKLEEFRVVLTEIARRDLDESLLQPTLRVDAVLTPEMVNERLARDLAALEPFGHGNHEPVFMTPGLRVLEQRRLAGRTTQGPDHLKLRLESPLFRRGLDAVFWRSWGRAEECAADGAIDACYTLEMHQHNGYRNLQLNLKDLRPTA